MFRYSLNVFRVVFRTKTTKWVRKQSYFVQYFATFPCPAKRKSSKDVFCHHSLDNNATAKYNILMFRDTEASYFVKTVTCTWNLAMHLPPNFLLQLRRKPSCCWPTLLYNKIGASCTFGIHPLSVRVRAAENPCQCISGQWLFCCRHPTNIEIAYLM